MYDPIAEINTLRMNGYMVTEFGGYYLVNDRFLLDQYKLLIYDSRQKRRRFKWKKHELLSRIKKIENVFGEKMKPFNLIYYIGTRKVETIASNKPRAICQAELNKRKYSENYKSGTLKIEPIN